MFIAVAVFAYDFKVNGIYYNILSDANTCEVTHKYSYNEDGYGWEVSIPSSVTYNGTTYTVTGIGSSAFSSSGSSIRNVIIPSSVTTIGSHAFDGCTYITDINIPSSVTEIGAYAFQGTAWYKNQSDGMIYAGKVAYEYKGLMPENTSIIIKDGTKGIGEQAFYYKSGLTSITIPSSVTSIGNNAFRNCSGLTSITIPSSVTSISNYAFYGCSDLTSVAISEGVTSIGDYAFHSCSSLTSVTIPSSVTTIGSNVFSDCKNLQKVIVPDIAKWCKISFASYTSNPLYDIKHLYSDDNAEVTELVIPEGATEISDYAFVGCSNLTNVTIPSSVTSISSSAFSGCTGLMSITLNSDAMASKTYSWSSSLKNIFGEQVKTYILGGDVTSIGNYAFSGCSGLTSITIPNSVASIGNYAFSGCTGLTKVIVPDIAKWCRIYFNATPLYYAKHLYSDENTEIRELAIPDGVTYISSSAFSGCTGLTSITIPEGVTSIGSSAFTGCTGVTSVTFPSSVKSIGSSAFSGCTGLTSVTIPSSVTEIGSSTFSSCTGLTSITIPSSVTSIGSNAFSGCSALTDVSLNSNAIVSKTYSWSSSLKNIFGTQVKTYTMGDNVTTIGESAFHGCSDLASITIPSSVTSIGSAAFHSCSGLTSITIPSSVTSIDSYAFSGCTGLTSIILPDNITSLASKTNFSSFPTGVKLYVNIGSKTLLALWNKEYSNIYDAETQKEIYAPYLSEVSSTQTTLKVKLNNRYNEYVYMYGGKAISDDYIISFSDLRPEYTQSVSVAMSSGNYSYFISRSFSTDNIKPSVTENAISASSISVSGNHAIGDAKVVKETIKFNGKEIEGKSISVNGLNPNTSYDVEYTITVAYGDNNQSTYSYTGTKTVKTKELTLTTEQPKVVSSGNVIVSATTNVDEEEKNVGFEWRRTDWTSDFASNSGNAVIYDNTMEGYIRNMNTDKLWKYRAYYLSDNGTYYYGDWVGLDASNTSYFEPTVHTYADISTTGKVALIRGYVLNGTDKIKVQGFKYWKTANKSNSLDIAMEGEPQAAVVSIPADAITETVDIVGAGQQMMNATLENLDYGSTYQCVAFATTSENETFYGEVQSFTTEADPTGIEGVKEDAGNSKPATVVACYDINGKRLSQPQKGLNILRMSDGTTKKVVR